MALIDRPEDLDIDSNDKVVHLTDDEGESSEEELSGLIAHIRERFTRAKSQRQSDEDRWLQSYRNYRGQYDTDVQFTDTEKSRAFIKITKTKVLAAYAQIVDILFAGGKFPIGVEPTPLPKGVLDAVHFDPKEINEKTVSEASGMPPKKKKKDPTITRQDILDRVGGLKESLSRVDEEDLREGAGVTPSAITYSPAADAARAMEKRIHDQLDESEASKHLRSVAFEMSLFGTGILKGPFTNNKEYAKWDKEGNYTPQYEMVPRVESVSIWNFYPDPDARNMSEAEYVIERHRMNRQQLRNLKKRAFFRAEAIEDAIAEGPSYSPEYWEDVLDESDNNSEVNRFDVLEYWGVVDREIAEEAELDIPEDLSDMDQLQINAWVCNGNIIRLVLNPFTPTRIPYHAVPYELNPYSFFGIGLAENMADTQLLMNGFMRMAVDNAALSSNLLIEIDETNLVPGQDLDVYPGKIFRRQAGAPGQAIFGTKFPNVTQECLLMFDKARQLSDESTGMPSYAHGSTGIMSTGRTASGMSMLMGAAAQNIKAVVRNIDDYLLSPLGRSLFAFNMQFKFDEAMIQGDLEIRARGTESLMRNEIRSQRLLQFMQMTANPMMAPFVKYDYILREIASSMDLDEDKILNDPREAAVQAQMMAELAALMPQGQGGNAPPQAEAAGVNDPTGTGGGTIAPGMAPEPGAQGFTGGGGGDNGGNQPPPQQG